ncbi:toprim domain-containing protein [Mycobacterium avium]|uniref:toprim domain-containing protein n=1 Tax=Mycobacterium avium TaxID=1764 RepID=UPI0007A04559|nr:toprim domain-containing protein [Mycobacterium avium]
MASTAQIRSPGTALDQVRDALHAAGHTIRPRGGEAFMASCPLHTDHSPSLSVGWRDNTRAGAGGAVLLHCFSCQAPAAEIAGALGLRLADLFDNPAPTTSQRQTGAAATKRVRRARGLGPLPARITAPHKRVEHRWRRVRTYTYLALSGEPVQQVIREECTCTGRPHKQFRQRYRHADQWVYRKPHGFTPVLYRPNAIQAAAKSGAWVWVTEGEKDADTLTTLGRLATTNAQGAANFPAELVDAFTGLNVVIVADRDLAGYQRAITLHERLHTRAAQVVLLTPAIEVDKADVTDHVDAGLWDRSDPFGGFTVITPADLHALAEAAKARCAADRFDTALREACAHRDRRGLVPGSARNAARWLAEAAAQLRAVHRIHAELQSHSGQHGASGTCRSAHTVESLLERLTADYRSAARRPLVHQPARFKESA